MQPKYYTSPSIDHPQRQALATPHRWPAQPRRGRSLPLRQPRPQAQLTPVLALSSHHRPLPPAKGNARTAMLHHSPNTHTHTHTYAVMSIQASVTSVLVPPHLSSPPPPLCMSLRKLGPSAFSDRLGPPTRAPDTSWASSKPTPWVRPIGGDVDVRGGLRPRPPNDVAFEACCAWAPTMWTGPW